MHRIVHALRLDLGPIPGGAPDSSRELIVNLDRSGKSTRGSKPRGKSRMVDVRPGDEVVVNGRWTTVVGVRSFLAREISEDEAAATSHGYVYRVR